MGWALGRVLGVLLLNFVLARIPLKASMIGAAWVMAVGSAAAGFLATGLLSLFVALLVTGVAVVIPSAICGIWVGAHVLRGTDRAMLMIGAFFALGVVIAPLAIGVALELGATWRWVFLGLGGYSVVTGVALTVVPLADVPQRENLRVRQLREAGGFNPRLLMIMLVAAFFYVATETSMSVWLAKFQVDAFGARPALAALSVTLFWVGMTVGRYAAVPISRRVPPPKLLAAFAAGLAVFGVGAVLSPTLAISEACVFFAGLGASACWPLVAFYTSGFPSWYSGVTYSGMLLAGTTASSIFPYLVGLIADALGLRVAVGLSVLPAILVVILAFVLPRDSKEEATVIP